MERRDFFAAVPTPYVPTPNGVPGTIEAENYNVGGQGVGYHTTTTTNAGGALRHDGVGIAGATDAGGGYYVGWALRGDWYSYTVNVAATATYTLNLRVASLNGGTCHLSSDGASVSTEITLPNTGGWQTWKTISTGNIQLTAGTHVFRLTIDSAVNPKVGAANFNWLQLKDNPLVSSRTAWWRNAKYGMFIHWGLYSQLAGTYDGKTTTGFGEWIEHDLNIPPSQYDQVAKDFNPTDFNAQTWVNTAKAAGMKYIVMTAQHHDGFAMYNSKVNKFNVVDDTPWGQDPIAQMATASRAAGLHFGVYFSIMNWNHPELAPALGGATSPSDPRVVAYFNNFIKPQVAELINQYHPDILWFDGEWVPWWNEEYGRELTEYIRSLDPGIIINNRVGKRTSADGDFDTPEQVIPSASSEAGRLWETCATLNDTWGYKANDNTWKTPAGVIQSLVDTDSLGGNFLENVGPDGTGTIPSAAVSILNQVGAWLNVNGSAIYNTTTAPVTTEPWGELTRNGDALYAIVFNWPTTGTIHLDIAGNMIADRLLDGGAPVPVWDAPGGGIDVALPKIMPQQPATVVEFDFSGAMRAT